MEYDPTEDPDMFESDETDNEDGDDGDGEPADIDSDEGFDPYAGQMETPYGEMLDSGFDDGFDGHWDGE